jgi:glycerophosphoryl diester phosphodiesterase
MKPGGPLQTAARGEPLLWAHRGASARAPANTLKAFALALTMGATGLETDVHLSSDFLPVLVHDPIIRRGGTWIRVISRPADELRRYGIPRLADLLGLVAGGQALSLDVNDPRVELTAEAIVREARGSASRSQLFVCLGDADILTQLAARYPLVHWVHSADRRSIGAHFDRHIARLADCGISVLNLRYEHWGDGKRRRDRLRAVHEAGLMAFAWDVQRASIAVPLLADGIDGIYGDDPAELIRAWRQVRGRKALTPGTLNSSV